MIEIDWPELRQVPNSMIEQWFVDALAKGQIHPADCGARTPVAMAEALDNAGVIHLRVNNPCDTKKDDSNEAL